MEKRTLGSTGLDVTLLGYGAAELRGPRSWGGRQITDTEAAFDPEGGAYEPSGHHHPVETAPL